MAFTRRVLLSLQSPLACFFPSPSHLHQTQVFITRFNTVQPLRDPQVFIILKPFTCFSSLVSFAFSLPFIPPLDTQSKFFLTCFKTVQPLRDLSFFILFLSFSNSLPFFSSLVILCFCLALHIIKPKFSSRAARFFNLSVIFYFLSPSNPLPIFFVSLPLFAFSPPPFIPSSEPQLMFSSPASRLSNFYVILSFYYSLFILL